jgi:dihydroorotase
MSNILIKNATIINEGQALRKNLLISDEIISSVDLTGQTDIPSGTDIIDATGLLLFPGIIDDHVHFREPGLTHKGDLFSESMSAVAGGVTSFMDMPNNDPPAVTTDLLNRKYNLGAEKSLANYSFYIGATDSNLSHLMNVDPGKVCGIKLFMGSSTGDMAIDNEKSLRNIFKNADLPLAVHCEDDIIIRKNINRYREEYGDNISASLHPMIRSREACLSSSSYAVRLASEYNTRLHILHLSTADEIRLLDNRVPPEQKRITAEACIHHLWFDDSYYEKMGNLIKWNPAIKSAYDRKALLDGINRNSIDVVATDHAPHTLIEKRNKYSESPSGGPLIQHSLVAMLELWHNKILSLEKIAEMMCHNPAIIFNVKERGFIREGYKADLCLVDPDNPWKVSKENILYKCGWSPFEGVVFRSKIIKTIVNGNIVCDEGRINKNYRGQRLLFDR